MDREDMEEFCINYINYLPQEYREEVFNIIRLYVKDSDIDSTNLDGSRILMTNISDDCLKLIWQKIKFLLE